MNIASWIILAIVVIWIGIAVRSTFFGGSKRRRGGSSAGTGATEARDDEKYKLPSACAACSKGSCAGCPSFNRDIPMPVVRELEEPGAKRNHC